MIYPNDILVEINKGVEQSSIFAAFLTQEYMDKANGVGPNGTFDYIHQEFKAAFRHKKIIIPILMEPGIQFTGHVGTLLHGLLWVDFTTPENIEENIDGLVHSMRNHLRIPAIPPNPTHNNHGLTTNFTVPLTSPDDAVEDPTSVDWAPPIRNFFQTLRGLLSFGSPSQDEIEDDLSFQEDTDMHMDQVDLDPIDEALAPFIV